MQVKLIPTDVRYRYRCKICGTNKSVKYRIKFDKEDEQTYCNRCVTIAQERYTIDKVRKESAMEIIDIINRALPTKEYEGERLGLICLIEEKFGISSESEE